MDHHCHIASLITAGRGETALWFVGMPGLTKPTLRVGVGFSNRQSGGEAFNAWKAGLLLDSAHELVHTNWSAKLVRSGSRRILKIP